MHALLAHMYHLILYAIHIATRPVWRPLGACLAIAIGGRLAGWTRRPAGASLVAGLAVLAGWLFEATAPAWPLPPVTRLTGLALLLTAYNVLRARNRRAWLLPVTAALGAWWLRGAPVDGPGILLCLPVFVGLSAALWVGERLAQADRGWAMMAGSGLLAAGLLAAGASPHWARAAGVPGMAALGLLGILEAMPAVAGLIVVVSLAALVASDQGRLVRVDIACLLPLLAWAVVCWLERGWTGLGPWANRRPAQR